MIMMMISTLMVNLNPYSSLLTIIVNHHRDPLDAGIILELFHRLGGFGVIKLFPESDGDG